MGFAVLGSGVGSVAISFGGQAMITQLGWRNSLRVIGGAGTCCLIFGVLLVDRRVAAVRHSKGAVHGLFHAAKDILKFKSARMFPASVLFFQFSFFVPYTYLASYSVFLELNPSFGGFALAMLGVGSAVGRLIFGPLADKFGRFFVYRATVLMDVIVLALWPACTTEASITAFAFFYGMFGGGFAAMFAVVASDLWGPERLSGFFTLVNLVSIPGAFAAGPVVGALIQATGSYEAAIGFTAGMMAIAFLMVLAVRPEKRARVPTATSPRAPTAAASHPEHIQGTLEELPLNDLSLKEDADLEANLISNEHYNRSPRQQDYLQGLAKYNVDLDQVKNASDEQRQVYIRAVQLSRFRETLPDPPEDLFTRALNALQENPFDSIKQKVYEKFGKIPDEWDYQGVDDATKLTLL
jgi:MFS family permease